MLLVREVVGPARSQIGTTAVYRATAFNRKINADNVVIFMYVVIVRMRTTKTEK